MANKMLIDATHPEETRVVVVRGNRVEEFDFESANRKQLRGNIYLAKVTRVEPSLQAAFVDYGGNRHGFLAFSEVHPDYYKIPVADKEPGEFEPVYGEPEALEAEVEVADGAGISLVTALPEPVPVPEMPEGGEDETAVPELPRHSALATDELGSLAAVSREEAASREEVPEQPSFEDASPSGVATEPPWAEVERDPEIVAGRDDTSLEAAANKRPPIALSANLDEATASDEESVAAEQPAAGLSEADILAGAEDDGVAVEARTVGESEGEEAEPVETLGGDELEEAEHHRSRALRHYKIQEVIKRRQIILVQVAKEERGSKGAALTTYLSLAGRYCVLKPNTARGGGVSRKITNLSDRRRLKDILEELDIPEGMGVIVRTAGAERSKAEIKRDYEYLLRLWNEIRDLTLRSTAPALIYEEGDLIKRSIRDLYTRDIDKVLVEGEEGYRTAKAFMKMLMPSHAKRVQPYRDSQIALFHRFQVESQIDAIHSPIVQLHSGGYVVINQAEALVAIDVNSGRATRERNIEETAVRTNVEAAEEIARQLRLRDLAGLIVIDFIDMEEHRNQSAVERRLKDALKNDRARIQVGRISAFGLLEMSRQRLRPSLVETSTQPCPHCGGTGFVRSTESTALYVLRSIEEEGMRRRSAEVCVHVPRMVALYILNQKRDSLVQLEARYNLRVFVAQDDALVPPAFRLERLRSYAPMETAVSPAAHLTQAPAPEEEEEEIEEVAEISATEQEVDDERGRSRRRRRRRRHHEEEVAPPSPGSAAEAVQPEEDEIELVAVDGRAGGAEAEGDEEEAERRRRRRGRRGGRRRRGRREGGVEPSLEGPRPASDTVEILPTRAVEEAEPTLVESRTAWLVETAAVANEGAGSTAPAGEASESAASQRPQPASEEVSASGGRDERPATPPTAETEQGVPYVSEAARGFDTAPSAAEQEQQPPHPAQTVTEKPANPRRGWWQRLIQP